MIYRQIKGVAMNTGNGVESVCLRCKAATIVAANDVLHFD